MKIKIYTSPSCTFCGSVKDYLNEQNVEFEEIDITSSQEALDEMKEKTGYMSVPIILIYDDDNLQKVKESIIGFDKERIDKALNICS